MTVPLESGIDQSGALFAPGRNCWRVEPCSRAAFLVDGQAYFTAFREAAIQARHSLFILGWDFDTRIRLLIDREPDGYPDRLGPFLSALLVRRRSLHVYVLVWDYHVIYIRERQWWLPSHLMAQRRLHFVKDDTHPLGASHHQKVVVIDDRVAFVGGLDFAQCRWDTPEHRAGHPDRTMVSDGSPCRPFHDVQMAVEGSAAAALGQLARHRWKAATGHLIPATPTGLGYFWPDSVVPQVRDIRIAIARTMPDGEQGREIREVEQLLVDLFRAARRSIYVETQYFTSKVLAAVLAERLQEPDGPDIVMILHPNSDGWLEQHTMDVLRDRVLRYLRTMDRYEHLGLYYPRLPDLDGQCISVHSKVCVIDDAYVRIGSANMSNRSMGVDSECDLAFHAGGDHGLERQVASFRNGLLAEHLGVSPEEVGRAMETAPGLIAAIHCLRRNGRSLDSFDKHIPPEVDGLVPDDEFIDPSRPYDTQLVPAEHRPSARRQLAMRAAILLAIVALATAWRWSPLGEWLELSRLLAYAEAFESSPAAPFITVGAFLVGGLVVAPVTVLIAATILTFGPIHGFLFSFVGMTLSALLTFFIGRLIGRQAVEQWSRRLHRLSHRLADKGVLAVITVRVVPVAPFTVINMIAGATHIRTRDFLLGTVIGELPGLIGLSIFVDQISNTIRHPGPVSYAFLAGSAAVILGGVWMLRRWITSRASAPQGRG
jgi:phosphatidylserine/phosphatidylglycerophosphate/cardiolipin synthase-like enzyme/uncharacterized membrane protein YdjX (TVP38/TMEM64 family)